MASAAFTVNDFIRKWHAVELKERSAAQEHFLDLCRLLGEPSPAEANPTGDFYCFERGVTKTSGGEGWADVWKRGHFGWEYKGKCKNLDAAFGQLHQYALALENPPLLYGHTGSDTAAYSTSDAGVTVDLETGTGSGGHAEGDVLDGIDFLVGSSSGDVLIGNGIGNWLIGGDGDDTLEGRDDNDMLVGGNGADTFAFDGDRGRWDHDTITDFSGEDLILLDAQSYAELAAAVQSGNDTVLHFEDGSITFSNTNLAALGADDFRSM